MKTKFTICCLLAFVCSARAEVWLPSIFGDHMVLQQGLKLPVWGKADPGEKVTVSIAGKINEATADADGKWQLRVDPLAMSHEPLEMRVKGNGEVRVFHDVLVGDVWLCSGQSNMGLGVGASAEATEILAGANRPELRLFRVGRNVALTEQDDLPGKWVVCTPESILEGGGKGFSAIAYLFGSEIQNQRKIPVGLIESAVGGTRIQCWSSLEMLQSLPALGETKKSLGEFLKFRDHIDEVLQAYETERPALEKKHDDWVAAQRELNEKWRKQKADATAGNSSPPPQPSLPPEPQRPRSPKDVFSNPTVLFNGMIRPLIPFGIKGVIWYQGEANTYPKMVDEYQSLLTAMITDWRSRWQQENFPFLLVQLPNLRNGKIEWATIREAQRQALTLPATGMAVTIDVGDPNNLHPPIKQPFADRLVLAARHVAYGEDLVSSGPLIQAMTIEGAKARLHFTGIGSGLTIGARPVISHQQKPEPPADVLQGFEVAGPEGAFHPANATIQNNTVVVWSEKVTEPKTVRYAWAADPQPFANLYNRENLPASPFSTGQLP